METDWGSGGAEDLYHGSGYSSQMPFNYNQLEGRFKQLQGKTALAGRARLFTAVAMCSCSNDLSEHGLTEVLFSNLRHGIERSNLGTCLAVFLSLLAHNPRRKEGLRGEVDLSDAFLGSV